MTINRATTKWVWFLVAMLLGSVTKAADQRDAKVASFAIPTFHCLGLYWSPEGGASGREVKVRYREKGEGAWSEGLPMREHMYNDTIGGGSNGSFQGSPGPDCDIYGNLVSHCWDDGLEVEGGNRNMRIWGNYITQSMMAIGNAATSIGPLYIWRNLTGRSQWTPEKAGGNFLKMGFAGSEDWMTGTMYIFHNTMFAEAPWIPSGALGGNRIVKHTMSRNNILYVRSPDGRSASDNERNIDNDFDYDLYNGSVPQDQERHGVRGEPVYAKGAGYDPKTNAGRFQLSASSPGAGAGESIPNFSGRYRGEAPDMGAHQRGEPPMRFGVQAGQR